MYLSRLLSLTLALATFSHAVWAGQVTLKSTTSSVELVGELTRFDQGIYTIETDLGELEVDARTVTCDGASCPEIESLASKVSIYGNRVLINKLLVPLLENYSFSLGADIETSIETDDKSSIKITTKDKQRLADISIKTGIRSDLDAGILALKDTLIIKSGSAKTMENAKKQASVMPIAADALVAVTSDTNSVRSLSQGALHRILSGAIVNWKDLGGPDANINVYLPKETSGLAKITKEMGFDTSKLKTATHFDDLEELAKAAASDPYGLGFTNFSNLRTAKALPILGRCGAFIQPSVFNISSGSYPAVYYHYLQNSLKNPPIFIREFLSYLSGAPAREMIDRRGYPSLSVFENGLENQGNRIVHSLLTTSKSVPITEVHTMLSMLNGARQLSTVLRFTTGTEALVPQSSTALEALMSELFLGNYADQAVMIIGFTESKGNTRENKRLSKASAQLVSRLIKDTDSSDPLADLQIDVLGFGEASPLACEDTPEGAAINNRVEIWVKDKP